EISRKLVWNKAIALQRSHDLKSQAIGIKADGREHVTYTIVPEQQLYKNRSSTHHLNIGSREPADGCKMRKTPQGTDKTKDSRQDHAHYREYNSYSSPLEQNRQIQQKPSLV